MSCYRNGRVWPLSRPDYDDNREARGYVAAVGARGSVVLYSALFGVVALNTFALTLADCNGDVFGGSIKASSVVSTLATAEGIGNSLFSPFFGGFADVTPHRKLAYAITFAILMSTLLMQVVFFLPGEPTRRDPNEPSEFLPEPLFKEDVILLLSLAVFGIKTVDFELNALLATSYSPELTNDEAKQHGFIADSFVCNNGSQLLYVLSMTGIALALGLNAFESAVGGAIVCLVWCTSLCSYGYPKLGERRDVNPDHNKKCLGVYHLVGEVCSGIRKYPDVYIFLASWAPLAASASNSVSLATSYLQFHLNFASLEVQVLLALALITTVPGSVLSRFLMQKVGLPVKKIYIAVGTVQCISFILAPLVLISEPVVATENATLSIFGRCPEPVEDSIISVKAAPGMLYLTAAFILLWGLMIGMIYPLNTALYSLLIPGGKETTYFGIKVTFSKVLNWLPALLFTIINEGGSLQWSIAPLGGMAGLGAFIALFIDMDRGAKAIEDTLGHRRGAGKADAGKTEILTV